MFKLRETWHDVFPATKLYQLDVKVNLIDPAWPIQAQPQQSNIHVNPNFLKKVFFLVNYYFEIGLVKVAWGNSHFRYDALRKA